MKKSIFILLLTLCSCSREPEFTQIPNLVVQEADSSFYKEYVMMGNPPDNQGDIRVYVNKFIVEKGYDSLNSFYGQYRLVFFDNTSNSRAFVEGEESLDLADVVCIVDWFNSPWYRNGKTYEFPR